MALINILPMKVADFFDLYAREFFSPLLGDEKTETFSLDIEVTETQKGYSVRAEIPGVKEDEIQLSLEDNVLVLEKEGVFYETIPLRVDVDDNQIEATFRDGVLSVELVKKSDGTEKTKRIQIKH